MLSKLFRRAEDEKGFTLIELLVVILIIGILAAIAIPSFLSQTSKAHDAAAKSQVRTAQTGAETLATDQNGSYNAPVVLSPAYLKTQEPTLNDTASGASLTYAAPGVAGAPVAPLNTIAGDSTSNSYVVASTVTVGGSTGNVFEVVRHSDGTVERLCTKAGTGGCPGSGGGTGQW